jgi:hypothetical protein
MKKREICLSSLLEEIGQKIAAAEDRVKELSLNQRVEIEYEKSTLSWQFTNALSSVLVLRDLLIDFSRKHGLPTTEEVQAPAATKRKEVKEIESLN